MTNDLDIYAKMRNFKAYLEGKIKEHETLVKSEYNDIHTPRCFGRLSGLLQRIVWRL